MREGCLRSYYNKLTTTLEGKYSFFIFPEGSNSGKKSFVFVHSAQLASVVPGVESSHMSPILEKQVIDGGDLRFFKVRWDIVIEVLVAHFGALNWKLSRLEMVSAGRYRFLH